MRIIIIGGVAAGTSAAAKARRNDDFSEIVIYEKGGDISYSGCGMPYYIGDDINDIDALAPRDPAFFKKKYNVDVKIFHEVLSIDADKKTLSIKVSSGEVFEDTYDKLVIATGAIAFVPPIKGVDSAGVFKLRTLEDTRQIKEYITKYLPKTAVVVGSGFIGLEILDNFLERGIKPTLIERAPQLTPNLDADMAKYLASEFDEKNIEYSLSANIAKIEDNVVYLDDGEAIAADIVIVATGVRPNIDLAVNAGVELGQTGAIKTDDAMRTNVEGIYACGDCIETCSAITGTPVYVPLGSTANKTGRIAGDALTGGTLRYKGNLGTGIFKVLGLTVAATGLTEKRAKALGFDIVTSINIKPDKPEYAHGKLMIIKAVADKSNGRLLGVQIIGPQGVDKRIDVFATLITYGATVDELFHLDLAYAPPFATTKDPVHYTGMILDNAIHKGRKLISSRDIKTRVDMQIIDARSEADYQNKGCVDCAKNMPHAKLRDEIKYLDKDKPTVTYCNKGVTGNAAQNILINRGFKDVSNLSGGHLFYKKTQS